MSRLTWCEGELTKAIMDCIAKGGLPTTVIACVNGKKKEFTIETLITDDGDNKIYVSYDPEEKRPFAITDSQQKQDS